MCKSVILIYVSVCEVMVNMFLLSVVKFVKDWSVRSLCVYLGYVFNVVMVVKWNVLRMLNIVFSSVCWENVFLSVV